MEEFKAGVSSCKVILNKVGMDALNRIKANYQFYDELKLSTSDVMNVALIYLDKYLCDTPRKKTVKTI